MSKSRNSLYVFLLLACAAGYTWLAVNVFSAPGKKAGICLFKMLTNIPCPSCGATRSVLALLNGNLGEAFSCNPLGYFIGILMITIPVWILMDLILKKESFFLFYQKAEHKLRQKTIAIPSVLLILLNWLWNIHKGM